MIESIRSLFRKRHKPIQKMVTSPHKSRIARKPVPVETPEAAEVKRRMAEEERKRGNDRLLDFFASPKKKPATREEASMENSRRIIIATARYTEDAKDKERLKEARQRIVADVQREAKEKEIG
tara:strand:+ start:276 stop:644 length:369 start_codon:yes stop_codon:yes gene_type:complete